MSKLVVFGAGGFIGRHLVRQLAKEEANTIIAFGSFSRYQVSAEDPFNNLANVTVFAGNFLNRQEVSHALEGADYVFHFVSSTNPAVSSRDPFIDIETNVRSSIELFDLCIEQGVKKIIFPSSGGSVYGNVESERIDETLRPEPLSPYGIGKLTIEHYLRYFKHTANLDYIIYRIANPYGPGQNIYGTQGIIPIFMHRFLTGEQVTIYGDGSMVRDYLYIDDLVDMISRSYAKVNNYNEYNLGSGTGRSVNDIFEAMKLCTGRDVPIKHEPNPPTFVSKSVLDISRFESEFGAQKFLSLNEGMERTWDYVKQIG